MKTHLRQGAAKLPAADFRAGQGAPRNMMRIDGQFVISRETVSLYFFCGSKSSIDNKSQPVYNTDEKWIPASSAPALSAAGDNRESGASPERSGHCKRGVRRKRHCKSEKARRVMKRKPGDLLGTVWMGIFRRKGPVRRAALLDGGGYVSACLGPALSGSRSFFAVIYNDNKVCRQKENQR